MDNGLRFYEGEFPCSFDKPRISGGTPALLGTQEVMTAPLACVRMQGRVVNLSSRARGGRGHLALCLRRERFVAERRVSLLSPFSPRS